MRGVSAGLSNEADKKDRYQPNCSRCLIWSGDAVKKKSLS